MGARAYDRNYRPAMWRVIRKHMRRFGAIAVEVGTYQGHWARGLLDCVPHVGKLYCVDDFRKGGLREWVSRMGADFGSRVTMLRGRSVNWASLMPCLEPDLLYIDGSHSYQAACDDLRAWCGKVRPGGLVLVHDVESPKVARACVDHFRDRDALNGEADLDWLRDNGGLAALGPVGRPDILTFWRVKEDD